MSDTQASIRHIACNKFRNHLETSGWIPNTVDRMSQTSRSSLRSSLFSFQHELHTRLKKQHDEIETRRAEWDKVRERGRYFGALLEETERLERRLVAVELK